MEPAPRILLLGYNYFPELTGIGKYSGEMIDWLAKNGNHCTVVTSYPYYPQWKVQEPYRKSRFYYKREFTKREKGSIEVYRSPMYVPSTPTGLKRVVLDASFFVSSGLKIITLLLRKKYDLIVVVAPSFQLGLLGLFYKSIKKSKLLYHIQDLQIEAAEDLQMIKSRRVLKILYGIERYILKHTDFISSISDPMIKKIAKKASKDVYLFPNWVDKTKFYPISDKDGLKHKFGFNSEDTIVLYSGGIGEKQGLETILYAAKEYNDKSNVKFVICGTGPYKHKLETKAQISGLTNIYFFPLQPMTSFNEFLNMADVHLVIQKAKASDLVMPSKLTTIFAIGGLALITANDNSGLYQLIKKHDIGILVDAENDIALVNGLKKGIEENLDYLRINALEYSNNYQDINEIMTNFSNNFI